MLWLKAFKVVAFFSSWSSLLKDNLVSLGDFFSLHIYTRQLFKCIHFFQIPFTSFILMNWILKHFHFSVASWCKKVVYRFNLSSILYLGIMKTPQQSKSFAILILIETAIHQVTSDYGKLCFLCKSSEWVKCEWLIIL